MAWKLSDVETATAAPGERRNVERPRCAYLSRWVDDAQCSLVDGHDGPHLIAGPTVHG